MPIFENGVMKEALDQQELEGVGNLINEDDTLLHAFSSSHGRHVPRATAGTKDSIAAGSQSSVRPSSALR